MKKLILFISVVVVMLGLSSCGPTVDIEPGRINVVYEDIRFEGENLVVDIILTNGLDTDEYISNMDFAMMLPDGETMVADGGFEMLTTIKSNTYQDFTLEFHKDRVVITESELEELGINPNDLILFFWTS